jgi:hypothetical protein
MYEGEQITTLGRLYTGAIQAVHGMTWTGRGDPPVSSSFVNIICNLDSPTEASVRCYMEYE